MISSSYFELSSVLDEIKSAVKSGNSIKVSVLKDLYGKLNNESVINGKEITETLFIDIVKKMIKQRNDAINMYEKGNRLDLAEKEKAEIQYLTVYMPKQMSEDEIKEYLLNIIKSNNIDFSKKMFGKVMGLAMKELKNKADGAIIKSILEKMS